jgi:hypothetical protein
MKWKFNLMVKFDWEMVDMVQCFLESFKEIMWQSLYISDIPSTAGSIILRDRQGKLGSGDRSLLAGKNGYHSSVLWQNTVKWDYFTKVLSLNGSEFSRCHIYCAM